MEISKELERKFIESAKKQIDQKGNCRGIDCFDCRGHFRYNDDKFCNVNGWCENIGYGSDPKAVESCKNYLKSLGIEYPEKQPTERQTIDTLITNVIEWAADKDLLRDEVKDKQLLKCLEELGELSRAHLKQDTIGIIDGIGDVLVTLIIFARQNNLSLHECLDHAYNEIKNRTGKTVNNTFVKDEGYECSRFSHNGGYCIYCGGRYCANKPCKIDANGRIKYV